MENRPEIKLQRVRENIQDHFGFLFDCNYKITSIFFTDTHNKNWNVIIAGANFLIRVHCHDKKLRLALCSLQLFEKTDLFDLYELLYLMNEEDGPLPENEMALLDEEEQIRTAALLLENHLDEISILFQRIDLGISFSKTGALFQDNSPVFLFRNMVDIEAQPGQAMSLSTP